MNTTLICEHLWNHALENGEQQKKKKKKLLSTMGNNTLLCCYERMNTHSYYLKEGFDKLFKVFFSY